MDAPTSAHRGPLDCRILLAEDDRDHQPLLCLMLERAGSEVTVAENGRMAVELVCEARDAGRPFELIVMDLQMPVLDGLSATRQLRADGFTSPIIALTARAVSTDRERCFAAGCDDFLSKPVNRLDLVRLLAAHLKRIRLAHAAR
ncbi:MAG: response regulator [Thermoguttaceae bacterium]